MTYVITQKCVGTCHSTCVDVCPVDCIHGPIDVEHLRSLDPSARKLAVVGVQLFINPDDCIHCGACLPECPVDAIYAEEDVPARWQSDIAANANFFAKRCASQANKK
jgi:NAD-dependent dihydropyrimidine dehydrogenase PreA subunit